MRLIGNVYVGLHCFCVFEKEKVDDTDSDGVCDREAHHILVKAGNPLSRKREVLMHELFHLAYYHNQMAVGNAKDDEETVCTRVAPSIAEMLNRNPWISAYIEDRSK